MKMSKILTVISMVLAVLLCFSACDIFLGQEHACESKCETCGLCTDAECTEEACAEKCAGHTPTPVHTCESACTVCGKCLDGKCTESACADKCLGHHQCEYVCATCGKCLNDECTESVCADKCQGHHVCGSICATCEKCLDDECTDPACADKCQGHHKCEDVCATCGKCTSECDNPVCAEKCPTHHECAYPCDYCGKCENDECTEKNCAEKCECTTPVITIDPTPEIFGGDNVSTTIKVNVGDDFDPFDLIMLGVTVTDAGDEEPLVYLDEDNSDELDLDTEGEYTIVLIAENKYGKTATASRIIIVEKARPSISLEVNKNAVPEKWASDVITFANKEYYELTGDATYTEFVNGIFHNNTNGSIVLNVASNYAVIAVIDANGVVVEGRDGANNRLVNADYPTRANGKSIQAKQVGADISVPAGGYVIVVQTDFAGTGGADNDGRTFMNYSVIGSYGTVVRLFWADKPTEYLTTYVNQAPVVSGNNVDIVTSDPNFDLATEVIKGVTAMDDNGTFVVTDNVTIEVTIVDNGGFDINTPGTYNITLKATDGEKETIVTRKVIVDRSAVNITIGNNSYSTLADLVAVDKDENKIGSYLFFIYTPAYKAAGNRINYSNTHGEAFVLNKYGEIVRIYDGANGKYYDANNKSGVQNGTCTAAGYLAEAFGSLAADEYLIVAPNGAASRAFLLSNRTMGAKVVLPGVTFAPHECTSICPNPACGKCMDKTCTETACVNKCECPPCTHVCPVIGCGLCTDAASTEYHCANKCPGHKHLCESPCQYCGKCADASCTEEACTTKCEGHSGHLILTIGSKKYEATEDKWAKNQTISAGNAASKAVWIFDKSYTGSFATNGYGVAVVLDADMKVVRVYDGANAGYTDANTGVNDKTKGVTTSNFATLAWSSLQAGETLVILPNGGSDSNAARQVGLDCRYLIGQKMNFAFPDK